MGVPHIGQQQQWKGRRESSIRLVPGSTAKAGRPWGRCGRAWQPRSAEQRARRTEHSRERVRRPGTRNEAERLPPRSSSEQSRQQGRKPQVQTHGSQSRSQWHSHTLNPLSSHTRAHLSVGDGEIHGRVVRDAELALRRALEQDNKGTMSRARSEGTNEMRTRIAPHSAAHVSMPRPHRRGANVKRARETTHPAHGGQEQRAEIRNVPAAAALCKW